MSQPQVVSDGDFTSAAQNGPWSYEYPFADRGDRISFVATRKMRQDYSSFTAPVIRSTRTFTNQYSATYPKIEVSAGAVLTSGSFTLTTPATAYLCSFTNPQSIDDYSSLVEWTERWCNVPITRMEFGSLNYTQVIGLDTATLNELQFNTSFDAYFVFEYALIPDTGVGIVDFIKTPPTGEAYLPPVSSLPQLRAPRVIKLGEDSGTPVVKYIGTPSLTYQQGVPILANDSTSELYEGIMLCRKSPWIVKATLTTL